MRYLLIAFPHPMATGHDDVRIIDAGWMVGWTDGLSEWEGISAQLTNKTIKAGSGTIRRKRKSHQIWDDDDDGDGGLEWKIKWNSLFGTQKLAFLFGPPNPEH